MRTADNWKDYEILDTSDGEKLEIWGGISLVRPDPQIIWKTEFFAGVVDDFFVKARKT